MNQEKIESILVESPASSSILQKIIIKNRFQHLSQKSYQTLESILDTFDESCRIPMPEIIEITKKSAISPRLFSSIPESIRTNIKTHIINKTAIYHQVLVKLPTPLTVSFFYPTLTTTTYTEIDNDVEKYYQSSLRFVIYWIHFIQSQTHNPVCIKPIHVYLFMMEENKTLPLIEEVKYYKPDITETNVNTAFTYSCITQETTQDQEIVLFRKEEWRKVFIHETLHTFGLDFSGIKENKTNQILSAKLFQGIAVSNVEYRLYETYCEVWAEIIHLLFFIRNKHGKQTQSQWRKDIQTHLFTETAFSFFQCAKIADYKGFSFDDLIKASNKIEYREKTAILSYYFLKTVVLFYLEDFLKWNRVNNVGFLDFRKTPEIIQGFAHFFKRGQSPEFRETMKKVEKIYEDLPVDIDEKSLSLFKTTLRMTYSA